MAKGKTAKHEARRSARESKRQERERKTPLAPEHRASAEAAREARKGEKADFLRVTRGSADYETPVREHLARVGGRSRSDVVSDRDRKSGSPLGGGSHSKPGRR